jgi:hypothetical protein
MSFLFRSSNSTGRRFASIILCSGGFFGNEASFQKPTTPNKRRKSLPDETKFKHSTKSSILIIDFLHISMKSSILVFSFS